MLDNGRLDATRGKKSRTGRRDERLEEDEKKGVREAKKHKVEGGGCNWN